MFRSISSHFLGFLFLFGYFLVTSSVCAAQDARLIAKNTFPSVVLLEMQDSNNRPTTLGSGFFVRPDIVATNYHVIQGASSGVAKIVGETTTYRIEGTVGIDKSRDLALLKLTGASGKPLTLADISHIEVGQEVFALGNPRGLEGTISPGIISGMSIREVENENLIQITAPISPGSSGGPVVNRKGEVIGVAVASLKNGQNLNFAVPSSYLALLLANQKSPVPLSSALLALKENSSSNSNPSVAETTAWLTDKLSAKGGVQRTGIDVLRNERLVFDNCTMNFIFSRTNGDDSYFFTYVANLSNILMSFDEGELVWMNFSNDTLQVKQDDYHENRLTQSKSLRGSALYIWVGDRETGSRVIKAFRNLTELCRKERTREPF